MGDTGVVPPNGKTDTNLSHRRIVDWRLKTRFLKKISKLLTGASVMVLVRKNPVP